MSSNMLFNNISTREANMSTTDSRKSEMNLSAAFGIAGLCFIIFGIIANIIAIIVLRQKTMRSLGTKLLVCLAFVDILLLILNTFRVADDLEVGTTARSALKELVNVTYPLFMTVYMGEIYMTALITVQRYVSVAKPLVAKTLMSKRRLFFIMALLGVWCIVFNIPQWVAFHPVFYYNTNMNITWIRHATLIMSNNRRFFKSTFYETIYIGYLGFIFRFLIPMTTMFVFNILIVRIVKQHANFRKGQQNHSQPDNAENRLTIMIIAITTTSLITTFLDALDLVMFAFLKWEERCSWSCDFFWHFADFMAIVNCCMNCIFYCVFGGKFRQICFRLFCTKSGYQECNSSQSMTTRVRDSPTPLQLRMSNNRCKDLPTSLLVTKRN